MNIAFPALLIFALLLPGFIFRHSYKLTEKTLLDFKPFGETTIKSVLVAFFIDVSGVAFVNLATSYYVDFASLLALLGGNANYATDGSAIQQTAKHAPQILIFFLFLYAASWIGGALLQYVIQKYKWDRHDRKTSALFRFDTPWFYLFTGYDEPETPDGVFVAAVVNIDGGPYLYVGVLNEYYFTETGDLDRLVLSTVSRRLLTNDRTSEDPIKDQTLDPECQSEEQITSGQAEVAEESSADANDRYYPIVGNYFVLKYAEILTLNISYIRLNEQTLSAPRQQLTNGSAA